MHLPRGETWSAGAVTGRCACQAASARYTVWRTRGAAVALEAAAAAVGGGAQPAERLAVAESVVHLQRQRETCSSRAGFRVPGMGLEPGIGIVAATAMGCGSDSGWSALHRPLHSDAVVAAAARPGQVAIAAAGASMMPLKLVGLLVVDWG